MKQANRETMVHMTYANKEMMLYTTLANTEMTEHMIQANIDCRGKSKGCPSFSSMKIKQAPSIDLL